MTQNQNGFPTAAAASDLLPKGKMSQRTPSSSDLSPGDAGNLNRAVTLSRELRKPAKNAEEKLGELRTLLRSSRKAADVRHLEKQELRAEALGKARNYLHFLRSMDQEDAPRRLKSITRKLRIVLQA